MIIKYQQGGGLPPFADYTPLNLPYVDPFLTTEASSNKSGSSGEDLGLKDLLSLLKDIDGLPNDAAFMTQLINSLLERASVFPLKSSDIASAYSQIFLSLLNAKHHKSEYDKALQEAQSRGALSEVAITSNGLLAVYDTENDKITTASIEQVQQSETLQPLTNSDLLNMNSHNSQYTFDMSLLDVVENGIGMTEIDKYIREATQSLGTTEISLGGYSVQDQQDIIAGLNVLKEHRQGMPLSGLYKNKMINENQAAQALKALLYVYNILPNNAKTLLKYKTGSVEGSLELIQSYIQAQQSGTSSFDTEYIMDLYGNKPGSKDTPKEDSLPDLTEAEKWLAGYGYEETFNLVGTGSDAITFRATMLSLTDSSDNALGLTTLQKASLGGFNGILDWRNITMGNEIIDQAAMDKVILLDGQIYKVELPLNQELLKQNIIAPDYNYSENKRKADEVIKERKITDKQEINAIYELHNLPIKYDAFGRVVTTNYATFGAIHAYALDSAFLSTDGLDTSSYLQEIADEKGASNVLQTYRQLNGLPYNDASIKDWDFDDRLLWSERKHNSVYKGVLYIPVKPNFANAKVGQAISPDEMVKLQEMQTISDTNKNLKTTSWNDRK